METLLGVLHVVTAVFLVGPMAVLPMTALRALRAGNGPMVEVLGTSTRIFSVASVAVAVLGFGIVGVAGNEYGLSLTTGWILSSIILYLVALVLSLAVVVPALRAAATELRGSAAGSRPGAYGRIAAGSGVVSLLLVIVTVLMVWKP